MNVVYYLLTEKATEEQRGEFDAKVGLVDVRPLLDDPRIPEELRGQTPPAEWLAAK